MSCPSRCRSPRAERTRGAAGEPEPLYRRRQTRVPFWYSGWLDRPSHTRATRHLESADGSRRRSFLLLLRQAVGDSLRAGARFGARRLAVPGPVSFVKAGAVGGRSAHLQPSSARAGPGRFAHRSCRRTLPSLRWPRSTGGITSGCTRRTGPAHERPVFPRCGCILTPRGAGEPDR